MNNLAPRLGLAWRPNALKGVVVRAGAGIYFSEFPWVLAADSVQGPPAGAGQNFNNPQSNPMPTYVFGLNIFAPRSTTTLTEAYAASLPPGTTVQALDPNFRTAHVTQWNFSIQGSAGFSSTFELDYLGSSGHQLPYLSDPSQCRPAANLFCDPLTRPYPQYGLVLFADSSGNSSYQGLIAKYTHPLSSGLNLHIEYAFAKALTDSWQSSLNINQITNCRRCSKGPATFDVRQRVVNSVIWALPFGSGQRLGANLPALGRAAVGGWSLSAIATFSSGAPVILTAPNQTGSAFVNPLPNRVCDGQSSQLSNHIRANGMLWFNTACFTVPAAGYFGNSGSTVLYGPGLDNWDLSFQKTFGMAERTNLQLRIEMFNALNHAEFREPNGNAGAGVNFGRISATLPPRLIQIALQLRW